MKTIQCKADKTWIREYEETLEFPVDYVRKITRQEQKEAAQERIAVVVILALILMAGLAMMKASRSDEQKGKPIGVHRTSGYIPQRITGIDDHYFV